MDAQKLDSSSEDEYDIYVNSVVALKALQNKVCTNHDDTLKENTGMDNKRKGRRKRQNVKSCHSTHNVSEDLEIVSVQEDLEIVSVQEVNDSNLTCKSTRNGTATKTQDISIVLDCSSDEDIEKDENYDVNVKILWRSKTIHRLSVYNHDSFRKVFQYFADMENVSIEQILITKKDKVINLTDTPSSIGLSIIDILEGGIVDENMIAQKEQNIEENICQIKVQTANKESIIVPLKKNQPFKILIASCARQWNVSESSIKLYFDGESINVNDTPESLDLEQEACIDLRISTKTNYSHMTVVTRGQHHGFMDRR
ncbi:hypothetical protein KPH14_007247 [Odynerus spinipes]|uniref:Rad60/SUMO-like domain-containing protein n=1 Tax=Odynerus spinipes TaxID=1348599 RepID=A0AAD9RA23_9HYME|nr:hypothetical protein KPH14_007247 [Odynerus spinipes]